MALLLLPFLILGLFFLAAVIDFVAGGGAAATQTGCNSGVISLPAHEATREAIPAAPTSRH
jgi:hypothetical protein